MNTGLGGCRHRIPVVLLASLFLVAPLAAGQADDSTRPPPSPAQSFPSAAGLAPHALNCLAPDYRVYEQVLADSRLNGRWQTGKRKLVLRATTSVRKYDAQSLRRIVPDAQEAIAPYLEANEQPAVFSSCFDPGLPLTVVEDATLDRLFGSHRPQDLFRSFYATYPDATGVITLSRVGFSPDGREALVYIHRGSGPLAAEGYLVLLRLERNGWKIRIKKLVVMS